MQNSSIVCLACVISLENVLYTSNSFGRKAHLQKLRVGFYPNSRHLHLYIQMCNTLLNSNYSGWRSWHTAKGACTVKQLTVASCFLWGDQLLTGKKSSDQQNPNSRTYTHKCTCLNLNIEPYPAHLPPANESVKCDPWIQRIQRCLWSRFCTEAFTPPELSQWGSSTPDTDPVASKAAVEKPSLAQFIYNSSNDLGKGVNSWLSLVGVLASGIILGQPQHSGLSERNGGQPCSRKRKPTCWGKRGEEPGYTSFSLKPQKFRPTQMRS